MPLNVRFLQALLLLSASVLSLRGWAQEGPCVHTLRGTVTDDHDATPLAFADVLVVEAHRSATADEAGRYTITGLCTGTWTVRVAHLGCEPVEQRLVLQGDHVLDLRLEHHSEELHELEVARQRPDENVGLTRADVGRDALEKLSGRDLATALSGIPGVTVLGSGPTVSKPVIHGLYGNRILTLNQGVRQEDQQWGTEHAPNLDPFSGDGVTVVKGAASVQYGADAIGGVIITEPAALPKEGGLSGEVGAVGILNGRGGGGRAMLQGAVRPVRGLGWRVQGSARRFGDSEAPDYVLSNTGLREAGGSASVGLQRHWGGANVYYSWFGRELGILRTSHIGNLTDLQAAIAKGEPWYQAPFTYAIDAPRQVVQHHLMKAETTYRISDRDQVVLTYGYQADDRQEYDIRRGGRSARPAIDLFLTTHTGDAVLKHWLGPHVHGKLGVNGVVQDNYNVPGTGIRPLIPDYRKRTGGVFLLEHFPVSERLELEAGARLEATMLDVTKYDVSEGLMTPEHRFVNHAWSVGANWSVRDSVRLRFNLGSAFRPPHVSELYSEGLHHGAAAIERGDPELGSERAVQATAGVRAVLFGDRLLVDATVHAARMDGYIYLLPAGYQLTIRGAFPVFDNVATDVLLHGLDASIAYTLTPAFSLRSRWSVVRGRDLVLDQWLFQMPADRTENALVLHKEKAGRWTGLEAALTSTVVFEQSRYPDGVDFAPPPGAYHLLGCSLSATLPLEGHAFRFGIQGTNLLNAAYRDYLDRFRYYADARGLDVSLWLRYSFGPTAQRARGRAS